MNKVPPWWESYSSLTVVCLAFNPLNSESLPVLKDGDTAEIEDPVEENNNQDDSL